MGTKANSGAYDCYANAEPDEPLFVLLGRDRHAPILVTLWSLMRAADGEDREKCDEAMLTSQAMADYLKERKPLQHVAALKESISAVIEVAQCCEQRLTIAPFDGGHHVELREASTVHIDPAAELLVLREFYAAERVCMRVLTEEGFTPEGGDDAAQERYERAAAAVASLGKGEPLNG